MDYSSDSGTPLYSYHPYKKISANRSTDRITGRGSKVLNTQKTKEAKDMINLLFGKEFKLILILPHSALGSFLRPWINIDANNHYFSSLPTNCFLPSLKY